MTPFNPQKQPIRFAGSELGPNPHICAFFRSPEEEYRVLLPFIKEGMASGDKAFHVVDPKLRADHLTRLTSAGIDVNQVQHARQLTLCNWEEVYLPDGRFVQERMLAMWQEVFATARQSGFPRTRLVAHMEWSLEDHDGVSDLLEYEARLNLIHRTEDPIICTYDLNKYSGAVLVDILRTHPMVILGGMLQENPFFVPAEEFLRELRERHGGN